MTRWGLSTVAAFAMTVQAQHCAEVGRSPREAAEYLERGPKGLEPECVGQALRKLASPKYVAFAPLAARYLGFEVPPKTRLITGYRDIEKRFPAHSTLFAMGQGAVPAVIDVLRNPESSDKAHQDARLTFLTLHRDKPSLLDGIRRLRSAGVQEKDPVAAGLLLESAQKLAETCPAERRAACQEAASR